jgi:predicted protein tyrosine phosphatase
MADPKIEKIKNYIPKKVQEIKKYLDQNAGPGINTIDQITPHIFISSYSVACDARVLRQYKIKNVLYLNGCASPKHILKLYKELEVTQDHIFMQDSVMKYDEFSEILETAYKIILGIVENKKNILIHCEQGISRSPTIVMYYLLKRFYLLSLKISMEEFQKTGKKEKLKNLIDPFDSRLLEIVKLVKTRRACIYPNLYFVNLLLIVEQNLKYGCEENIGNILEEPPEKIEDDQSEKFDLIEEDTKKEQKKREKEDEKKREKEDEKKREKEDDFDLLVDEPETLVNKSKKEEPKKEEPKKEDPEKNDDKISEEIIKNVQAELNYMDRSDEISQKKESKKEEPGKEEKVEKKDEPEKDEIKFDDLDLSEFNF